MIFSPIITASESPLDMAAGCSQIWLISYYTNLAQNGVPQMEVIGGPQNVLWVHFRWALW